MTLSTAYKCWTVKYEDGLHVNIEEIKVVKTHEKNKHELVITDERPENPRRVTIVVANGDPFWMQRHLDSLTDDLIFFQWFNVREHKKKKKKDET